MQNQNLNLNFKKSIVAVDGQTISINEAGPVNIVFFQAREQGPQGLNADVVAAIRLHNIDELKNLQKLIGDVVKNHENREK